MIKKFALSTLVCACLISIAPLSNADQPATAPANTNRILTFGGGPTPNMSQASLEQNILYLRRTLKELGLTTIKHDVYFTDGDSTSRTVELKVPADDFRGTIARLYSGDSEGVQMTFRSPKIENLSGPSTPDAIAKWFTTNALAMHTGEKLMIYFTGHGSPLRGGRRGSGGGMGAGINPPQPGSVMDMWGRTTISTKDLVAHLDKIDPSVDVTLVMVQCFSGGFANIIYKDADPAKGLSPSHRCGFFATTSTRMAAGCTADIEGDNYEEFSTSFFAALSGKSRAGKKIEKPDYDKDGATSFTEAFTYVILTSNTIDIPITTSDQLLRDKSRFSRGNPADAKLLARDVPYATLLQNATPAQKAALDGLSVQLNLTGENRTIAARTLATDIEKERATIQKTQRDAQAEMSTLAGQLRALLETRYPEFAIRWHPDLDTLITRDAKQIQSTLELHPSWKPWKAALEKYKAAEEKDYQLERKWVKTQRFLARAETVILAANLDKAAAPEIVNFYRTLLKQENQSLADWSAAPQQ